MHIWIQTVPNDVHSLCISYALSKLGHIVYVTTFSDFPSSMKIDFRNDKNQKSLYISNDIFSFNVYDIDIFIFRKNSFSIPSNKTNKNDEQYVKRNSNILTDSIKDIISYKKDIFSINDPNNAMRASRKPYQVYIADKVGLSTPCTNISNNFDGISCFVEDNNIENMAIKNLSHAVWVKDDSYKPSLTVKQKYDDILKYRDDIEIAPTIFQNYINKKYELRIVIMGLEIFSVKIDSQKNEKTLTDWRAAYAYNIQTYIEKYDLPYYYRQLILTFMKEIGLIFGSIDAIVTHDNDIIFLEVNPFGQFLWIEAQCPEIPLLQAFCDFAISRDQIFKWKKRNIISLSEITAVINKESENKYFENSVLYKPWYINNE